MTVTSTIRHALGAAALLSLSFGAGACGNPCEEVAEIACQKGGESAPECKKAREYASAASNEEKSACETVLGLVNSVNKQ